MKPFERAALECRSEARWESGADIPFPGEPQEGDALDIYVDISVPMGGFLPLKSGDGVSTLDRLADDLPGEMLRAFGGPDSSVQWHSFGRSIADLQERPKLKQGFFSADSSDLTSAVLKAAEDVMLSRSDAAVILTDLVATGDVKGPAKAAEELKRWVQSQPGRDGELSVGLLGVRAPYWGVQARGCTKRPGLGCWFSEQMEGWQTLDEQAVVPLYVVVLARSSEDANGVLGGFLDRVGGELRRHGEHEASFEVMSAGFTVPRVSLTCEAGDGSAPSGTGPRQVALLVDPEGGYRCTQSKDVPVQCRLDGDESAGLSVVDPSTSWASAGATSDAGVVSVVVDCAGVKQNPESDDLAVKFSLSSGAEDPRWNGWSKRSDRAGEALDATLRLEDFIGNLRVTPDEIAVECGPLLRAR